MSYFSIEQKLRLGRALITRNCPVYVQYYITSRCNMACEQCNIIYAHADVPEVNLDQVHAIARNLRAIGTAMVLLIGGEPFMRKDLPEIIRAFISQGIHVRMQTNGLASRERLQACVDAGGKDISISLDTLDPHKQETINGQRRSSFERAMQSVADVNAMFPAEGTAFFGTVLMPRNVDDIGDVIRFATAIGWGVSLVPAHVSDATEPRGFCTYDQSLRFPESMYDKVAQTLQECRRLRDQGYNLYDSDEYLDDIYRYVTNQPVQWRRRNGGVCDSPRLYFAIEPNGDLAPCCDYRLDRQLPVYDPHFPDWYRQRVVHDEVVKVTRRCKGCMYGSYPEMTITSRFLKPMLHRARYFNGAKPMLRKLTTGELTNLAAEIRHGREVVCA